MGPSPLNKGLIVLEAEPVPSAVPSLPSKKVTATGADVGVTVRICAWTITLMPK